MLPGLFAFYFHSQYILFRSPLPTGRKMTASINSLYLSFEGTKNIFKYYGPPYSPTKLLPLYLLLEVILLICS